MLREEIDTPAIVIDLDIVERNIALAQSVADAAGVALRPHIKTHKLPSMAKLQVAAGAIGITCQTLDEAEAMAHAGIEDIFIPYNVLGEAKLTRMRALHERIRLSVAADSAQTLAGYAQAAADAPPLTVLIECDTGAGRCGVTTPAAAVELARAIDAAASLKFGGLMTYPPVNGEKQVQAWLAEAHHMLTQSGLPPKVVSTGGTPGLQRMGSVPCATEYRPGTYIYSDRMQVAWGHGNLEDCALNVKATVVSAPKPDRIVLDAGSKALAADPVPAPETGHGWIREYPDAAVIGLSEEHAVVDVSRCERRPAIGDAVHLVPNHVCVVSNLFNAVHLVRGSEVVEKESIVARGFS